MTEHNDGRYIAAFKEAQIRSSDSGLNHKAMNIEGRKLSESEIVEIAKTGVQTMFAMGIHTTFEAKSQCMLVHAEIHRQLLARGISNEVGIGNVHLHGEPFFENITIETLLEELRKPNYFQGQNIHCWLTLEDSSVLDFTIYASLTDPKEPQPVEKNYVYIMPLEHDVNHFYQPLFVGVEYLARTGAIAML